MLKMVNNKNMLLLNEKNKIILDNVFIANNFISRLVGLMGKKQVKNNTGLLISPCNSVHTFFMKFNLDIIFIDKNNIILKIYRNMSPWKISKIHIKSIFCIEGNSGCFKLLNTGDKIKIIEKLD